MINRSSLREVSIAGIAFLAACQNIDGQAHFTQVAVSVGVSVNTTHNNWGCGLSFYDFDKDGWDDLSFSRFQQPPVFYKNNQGLFELQDFGIPNVNEAKMVLWGDYDNDGDADLIVTRYLADWSLYQNDGNFNFTDVTASAGLFQVNLPMTFGASWGDVNNDGWLDLYLSNYNTPVNQAGTTITNYLFISNGDGTFYESATESGVDDGTKHTFLTTWADINRDGWQDLYCANDRLPDSNDLFLNNGDGTFEDITDGSGADVYLNTMSNVVDDFDNDGDLDYYIANSEQGNNLLRNNGNLTFSNVAVESGVAVNEFCWGSSFLDFNLDGWKDLYVNTGQLSNTPTQNFLYSGDGDGTFTYEFLSGFQGHLNVAHPSAIGDFDNDGYSDLAVGVRAPLNCELWQNNLDLDRNFLKVALEGVLSNRDGIGSFIECYAGDLYMTNYILSGEGYMSQNSQHEIFGLGELEAADSLVVTWLSGVVDTFYNLPANQSLILVEGSSFSVNINAPVLNQICIGDSLQLTAGSYDSYNWSNGAMDELIYVDTPGQYWVEVELENGLILQSDTIWLEVTVIPQIEALATELICPENVNGIIEVFNFNPDFEWIVNGSVAQFPIENLADGTFHMQCFSGICYKDTLLVIGLSPGLEAAYTVVPNLCFGANEGAILIDSIAGGTGPVNIFPEVLVDLANGFYQFTISDSLGCEIDFEVQITSPEVLFAEMQITETSPESSNGSIVLNVSGGQPPYDYLWTSGQDSAEISGLASGDYSATITDANGCSIYVEGMVSVHVLELGQTCTPVVQGDGLVIPCTDVSQIMVLTSDGRTVLQTDQTGDFVDLSSFSPGVYLMHVIQISGRQTVFRLIR